MDKITVCNVQNAVGKMALFLILCFASFIAKSQDTATKNEVVEMANGMRSNGKIYVVVAVLLIILLGIFTYLFSLDKKISKLEKGN